MTFGRLYDKVGMWIFSGAILLFVGAEWWLWWRKRQAGFAVRLPLYFSVLLMHFINVSGHANDHFFAMTRYLFPNAVLLVLCAAHLSLGLPQPTRRQSWVIVGLGLVLFIGLLFGVQVPHWREYLEAVWFT